MKTILSEFLENLNLEKQYLCRPSQVVTMFDITDLQGCPKMGPNCEYKEVYFSTSDNMIYKLFFESRNLYLLDFMSGHTRKLPFDTVFSPVGYTIRIKEGFYLGNLRKTKKVTEIAPYFYYFPNPVGIESLELELLKKIMR